MNPREIDLSIVLPTYNESKNIRILYDEIKEIMKYEAISYELIYVDDSSDDTPEVIREIQKEDGIVTLIHREKKDRTGLSTAFMVGFDKAKGKFICCMDSDLQHPPSLIPEKYKKITTEDYNFVVASRLTDGGSSDGLENRYRHFVSKASRLVAWIMLPLTRKTSDPMTGFFMFEKELLKNKELRPMGFKILVELLVRVPEFVVGDIPMIMRKRLHDETKASFRQGIHYLAHIYRLRKDLMTSKKVVINGTKSFSIKGHADHVSFAVKKGFAKTSSYAKNAIAISSVFLRKVVLRTNELVLNSLFIFKNLASRLFGNKKTKDFVSAVDALKKRLYRVFKKWGTRMSKDILPRLKPVLRILITLYDFTIRHYVSIFVIIFSCIALLKLYGFADGFLAKALLTVAVFQIVQGLFALYLMIYAWSNPDRIEHDSSPKDFFEPRYSFTAILPAINEAGVIGDTIDALSRISYPEHLKETLVVLRDTDTETIAAAQKAMDGLGKSNIKIQIISGPPINKPHHLNAALKVATGDVVCIFDAEDEPHHEIYDVINTVMIRDEADVVQSGVQLMNFDSNWYSIFNVLEYFLWFRSSLHFFARRGLIPLGGNTVFFKTDWVKRVGGWDMEGLTEDADIGIRLSNAGAKIRVVYDAKHSTQEETPPTLKSFVKQRTRWSQGFLQILFKGEWLKDTKKTDFSKRFFTLYILGWPMVHGLMFITIPISLSIAFLVNVHPLVGIVSNIPFLVLIAFLIIQNVALYEFLKIYDRRWSYKLIFKTIVWFLPYQLLLGLSSFRAVIRQIKKQTSWEKTEHTNAHRVKITGSIIETQS